MTTIPHPMDFFSHLVWIDGRPLPDVIEPYRRKIFEEALYTFSDDGTTRYNLVLAGRAKKNWKSADLILAGLYRFLAWPSTAGNDCFLLANDEGQAADDLTLAKKIVYANPILAREVLVRSKELVRRDGRGSLRILPANDIQGMHGKTYLFVGFDEIHGYRTWDVFEALAPDPTRLDALTWITSYASIYNNPGAPLFDLQQSARRGDDERMYYTWYAADYCTDPEFEELEGPEERANPSMVSWGNDGYLAQQRRRLPTHKYRRLHLNLPGMPDGAFFDAGCIVDCTISGRKQLAPQPDRHYTAFVDMSGGSGDDACLAIAHEEENGRRYVLDLVVSQSGRPPFNPRMAVQKFARHCQEYRVRRVYGDRYAGDTFRHDFLAEGISYNPCKNSKSELYEELEPMINAGEVELLNVPKLQEQLLTLVVRGTRIDHLPGEHDDWANAAAGASVEVVRGRRAGWRVVPLKI